MKLFKLKLKKRKRLCGNLEWEKFYALLNVVREALI